MDKSSIDILYHKLRELSLTDDTQQKEAIEGITNHLTKGGDYIGLLRFLTYYGEHFLIEPAFNALNLSQIYPQRIVEFGAGFGWLGRGLAQRLNNIPTLFVDKRQYALIDIVADLESKNGRARVLDELKDGDVIVMSEFVHCMNNPQSAMKQFKRWPLLIIEYYSSRVDMMRSYNNQIKAYGAEPLDNIRKVFPSFGVQMYHREPYSITVLKPL